MQERKDNHRRNSRFTRDSCEHNYGDSLSKKKQNMKLQKFHVSKYLFRMT